MTNQMLSEYFSKRMKQYWAEKTPEQRKRILKKIRPKAPWLAKTKAERTAHAKYMNECKNKKYGIIPNVSDSRGNIDKTRPNT